MPDGVAKAALAVNPHDGHQERTGADPECFAIDTVHRCTHGTVYLQSRSRWQ